MMFLYNNISVCTQHVRMWLKQAMRSRQLPLLQDNGVHLPGRRIPQSVEEALMITTCLAADSGVCRVRTSLVLVSYKYTARMEKSRQVGCVFYVCYILPNIQRDMMYALDGSSIRTGPKQLV